MHRDSTEAVGEKVRKCARDEYGSAPRFYGMPSDPWKCECMSSANTGVTYTPPGVASSIHILPHFQAFAGAIHCLRCFHSHVRSPVLSSSNSSSYRIVYAIHRMLCVTSMVRSSALPIYPFVSVRTRSSFRTRLYKTLPARTSSSSSESSFHPSTLNFFSHQIYDKIHLRTTSFFFVAHAVTTFPLLYILRQTHTFIHFNIHMCMDIPYVSKHSLGFISSRRPKSSM